MNDEKLCDICSDYPILIHCEEGSSDINKGKIYIYNYKNKTIIFRMGANWCRMLD